MSFAGSENDGSDQTCYFPSVEETPEGERSPDSPDRLNDESLLFDSNSQLNQRLTQTMEPEKSQFLHHH